MGLENTITEQDLDAESRQFVKRLRADANNHGSAMDLDVDGLSDSILARLKRFFAFGRV